MDYSRQTTPNYNSILKHDDTEESEQELLSNLEAQTRQTSAGSDGFRPAVVGERAPLNVDSLGHAFDSHEESESNSRQQKRPSFKNLARKAMLRNRLMKTKSMREIEVKTEEDDDPGAIEGHRQAHSILTSIDSETANQVEDNEENEDEHVERMFTDFTADVFAAKDGGAGGNPNALRGGHRRGATSTGYEGLNYLLGEDDLQNIEKESNDVHHPLLEKNSPNGRASVAKSVLERRRLMANLERTGLRWKRWCIWFSDCLHPINLIRRFMRTIANSMLVYIVLLCGIAWILYYYFGNPELDFLPGTATLSWWFNFFARQLVLLDLARLCEFLLIDCLTMSSALVVQFLGPWVTIFCLQSKGWPFLVTTWGIFAMCLLHGDNIFQYHWLYWTGIPIYSQANSGSYIISSDVYLRVLIGMLLAGIATTLKRTVLTLHFGRRSFEMYKPQLEKILNEIVVLNEVAELAAEAENLSSAASVEKDSEKLIEASLRKKWARNDVHWSSLIFQRQNVQLNKDKALDESSSESDTSESQSDDGSISESESVQEETKQVVFGLPPMKNSGMRNTSNLGFASMSLASKSSREGKRLKNLLDRWQEPKNKLDKSFDSTVSDILKFRKALTYMDLEHPFGEAFGRASTREEMLRSSQIVYHNLLKIVPGSYVLPSATFDVLIENDDGTVNKRMKKAIKNIFRPDADKEIPMLSFIQACDNVYKKLRYFRASVGNSSVLDKVLEDVINAFFAFGLTTVILSILNFNPWPLLVSISTLLVSLAFAIGPTVSRMIEGMMLVVGTRPYDIGDRIIIANTAGAPSPGLINSWFVEDISLFRTTLRMAGNNEVATMNNAAMASSRITNCARSTNATIHIMLKLHIRFHAPGQNLVSKFQAAMESYINDNPTAWDSLLLFRCEDIDVDNEFAQYRIAVRSRHSWQVATRVTTEKGHFHQFCIELANSMNVAYTASMPAQIVYEGGAYKEDANGNQITEATK